MSDATPRLARIAGKPNWFIIIDGKRISTGTASRPEADYALREFLTERTRSLTQAAGQSVGTLLAAYLTARRREITADGADRLAYAHKALNGFFGAWPIDRINKAACLDYRDLRLETVASRTIRTELEALRAALHWGQTGEGGRVVVQIPDLKLPAKGEGRIRWLTRSEADRLLAGCKATHLRLFVEIGLHTGARSGAILSLTWDRVDLDERVIDFRPPGERVTKKRKVAQPIENELYAILAAAKANAGSPFVIERAGGEVGSIKHGFASACERAGLDDAVTPHTLRHTAITWALQAGVPIWEVSVWAGMTVKLIEDTYGHATVNSKRGVAKALERRAA
jgi:integrase